MDDVDAQEALRAPLAELSRDLFQCVSKFAVKSQKADVCPLCANGMVGDLFFAIGQRLHEMTMAHQQESAADEIGDSETVH
jgi:hypothetical protein